MLGVAWIALLTACGGSGPGLADARPDATADSGRVPDGGLDGSTSTDAGCALEVPPPPPPGHHVAVDGDPSGDGSVSAPWDLATALSHPAGLSPGDVVYLHGGVYRGGFVSELTGAPGAPVIVRGAPGEHAVIDGAGSDDATLVLRGADATYRDLEITNTRADRVGSRPEGLVVFGERLSLVNLVVHDLGNNGFWESARDLELYGCLLFHNGYDDADRAHGHAIYTQNREGKKRIEDNVVFGGFSFGIHAYTEGGSLTGFDVIGNVWFDNGLAAAGDGDRKDDCLIGGLQPADRVLLADNLGWSRDQGRSVRLGWGADGDGAVTLRDNHLAGALTFARPWSTVTMTGNWIYGEVSGVDVADHPDNEYVDARPGAPQVFVRPNRYERGRAHVVVYNWPLADTVDVDVSSVLTPGQGYELRDVQRYFSDPVLAGTFDGHPLAVPTTARPRDPPIGSPAAYTASETTSGELHVFVLRATTPPCRE